MKNFAELVNIKVNNKECVILEVKEDATLTVLSFNLQMGISKTLGLSLAKPGKIVIKASLLSNIITKMPDAPLHFTVNEKNLVTISCGFVEFTISGMENYFSGVGELSK